MNYLKSKEEMVNNSNQPHNGKSKIITIKQKIKNKK